MSAEFNGHNSHEGHSSGGEHAHSDEHHALIPTVVIAAVVYAILYVWHDLYFDLTRRDVLMIPVGALFFFVLWKTLSATLFAPYLRVIEARESATSGAASAANEIRLATQEAREQYEQKLSEARVLAMKGKIEKIQAAKKEAARELERAEGAAQEQLRAVRWDISNKITELRKETLGRADGIAREVVSRILDTSDQGRSVH